MKKFLIFLLVLTGIIGISPMCADDKDLSRNDGGETGPGNPTGGGILNFEESSQNEFIISL